jgi:hypothetical protein
MEGAAEAAATLRGGNRGGGGDALGAEVAAAAIQGEKMRSCQPFFINGKYPILRTNGDQTDLK